MPRAATTTKTKKQAKAKTDTPKAPTLLEQNRNGALNRAYEGLFLVSFSESIPQGELNADGAPSIDVATGQCRVRPTKWNRNIRDFFHEEGHTLLHNRDQQAVRAEDHKTMTIDDMVQLVREASGMGLSKEYIKQRFGAKAAAAVKNGDPLNSDQGYELWGAIVAHFYDLKFFGGLLNVGSDKLENVRGAVKIQSARSISRVMTVDDACTRGMITNEKEREKRNRTIGVKTLVPFALFAVPFAVIPRCAQETGFNIKDLYQFVRALVYCLPNEQSSYRRGVLHGLWIFQSPNHLIKRPIGRDWLGGVVNIKHNGDDPLTARSIDNYDIAVDESKIPAGVKMFDLEDIYPIVDDCDEFCKVMEAA
jgi:CRISPR-associated protein Csd2